MPYKIIEHPADFKLFVSGESLSALFADALKGMMHFLRKDFPKTFLTTKRKIELSADNPTCLLIDFLNESLAIASINKEIYTDVRFSEISDRRLSAELKGVAVDKFDDEIKAVTYHNANIRRNNAGWLETFVLFDI